MPATLVGGSAKQLHHWERVVHRVESSPLGQIYMMGSTLASQHYSTAVFASILVKTQFNYLKEIREFLIMELDGAHA